MGLKKLRERAKNLPLKRIQKHAKRMATLLLVGAMFTPTLAGCSNISQPQAKHVNTNKEFAKASYNRREAILDNEETSYLKTKGNLLAIQADKRIQHINATKHQRYPIPYVRSSDGNYWSWFQNHYLPHYIVKEELYAHCSDAPSNISDSDAEAGYEAQEFTKDIQHSLARHGINYGINYTLLGNSASNALDAYEASDNFVTATHMPVKYYSMNSKDQKWANKKELSELELSGNAKAKKADKRIEKLDKEHHQKYSIPYTKSPDGNYWSWYQKHSIPKSVIKKFYKIEKHHDSDYGLSSDEGYITHRFANDVQYNLMRHGVNYGRNYNELLSTIMNKYTKYEN